MENFLRAWPIATLLRDEAPLLRRMATKSFSMMLPDLDVLILLTYLHVWKRKTDNAEMWALPPSKRHKLVH